LGSIAFWTLIRTAVLIPVLWYYASNFESRYNWAVLVISVYLVIIHPIIIQYKNFSEKNKTVIEDSLCSRCKHFDESAVLCMKYDKHPTENYIPCETRAFEPK
jgi:hypothetical protein